MLLLRDVHPGRCASNLPVSLCRVEMQMSIKMKLASIESSFVLGRMSPLA